MKEEVIYNEASTRPAPMLLRRVSWGAIIAGLVFALVTQFVLSLLGVAIGASTFEPYNAENQAKGFGIGAAIWVGLSSIISIFVGAWVAGRLSGGPRKTDGMLHGLATWGATTLLTLFLLTTAVGTLIGGTASLLGKAVTSGAKTADNTTGGDLKQQAMNMISQGTLTPTGRSGEGQNSLPAQAQQNPELAAALTSMFAKGGAAADPQDRDKAINALASQGTMSREEAASSVDRWNQQYLQTKAQAGQKIREAGDVAATGIAATAWSAFAILLLSAIAAALGGWLGTRGLSYINTGIQTTTGAPKTA